MSSAGQAWRVCLVESGSVAAGASDAPAGLPGALHEQEEVRGEGCAGRANHRLTGTNTTRTTRVQQHRATPPPVGHSLTQPRGHAPYASARLRWYEVSRSSACSSRDRPGPAPAPQDVPHDAHPDRRHCRHATCMRAGGCAVRAVLNAFARDLLGAGRRPRCGVWGVGACRASAPAHQHHVKCRWPTTGLEPTCEHDQSRVRSSIVHLAAFTHVNLAPSPPGLLLAWLGLLPRSSLLRPMLLFGVRPCAAPKSNGQPADEPHWLQFAFRQRIG